ncbi:exodeoxyribonuclease V subunit alpha [Aliifodinibius sp. S!AR15-10]|uniref:exodeoxyribonuclease V subunit alpha n=1 Tax=Aliifodinibius sp. S!AR15-10 TaxID=2950437 RepID=UPI00286223D7|nr:exodeoxyribonuclease V subunit alpha [Aliifodinibius sp. S!AR15-10]MDR8391587.1 exodeoxyribonuclease V subunit alpha [Aliifodinibius sp. S!AR15-10]
MPDLLKQLSSYRDEGFISEISYQFCEFLKRVEPGCSAGVLLAGCLASQRREEGDVCITLADEAETFLFEDSDKAVRGPELNEWIGELNASECIGKPGQARPLILDEDGRLYLHKYWKYEALLAEQLRIRAVPPALNVNAENLKKELDALFDSDQTGLDWQKIAAWAAVRQKLTIISGGPGTGKTTTVVKILLLLAQLGELNHVALAAPTGKAASRLMESVHGALQRFEPAKEILEQLPKQAVTIHKLLGARRYGSAFRYNRENPLPYDLVVIDEASMIDLALMVKLVQALPDHGKLIMLGDKDQLASVEAGAVMGSICAYTENQFSSSFIEAANEVGLEIPPQTLQENPHSLTDHIILLEKSYRFGEESGIGQLAGSILKGREEQVHDILQSSKFKDVSLKRFEDLSGFSDILGEVLLDHFNKIVNRAGIEPALASISELGILCVHRRGPLGANQVNLLIEKILRQNGLIPMTSEWYVGKPVMVTRNDYSLGLRNGELGITLEDENGDLKVYFQKSEGSHRSFYPSRLSEIETAYAITVHKSQGSEFNDIAIVLPQQVSAVSSREMLYTAVTRARNSCTIIGSQLVLAGTVERKTDRSSGLKDRLWD